MLLVFVSGLLHALLPSHWLSVGVLARLYGLPSFLALVLFLFTALLHAFSTFLGMFFTDWVVFNYFSGAKYFSFVVWVYLEGLGVYYLVSFWRKLKNRVSLEEEEEVLFPAAGKKEASGLKNIFQPNFLLPYLSAVIPMNLSPSWTWFVFPLGVGQSLFYNDRFLMMLIVYFVCAITLMSVFMFISYQGLGKVKRAWLDRNNRLVLGILFVGMGFLNHVSHSVLNELKI